MKKKMLNVLLLFLCMFLTSCGSVVSDSSSDEFGTTMNSFAGSTYYNSPDYSNLVLDGEKIDYSYVLSAKGYPSKKTVPLSFYDDVVDYTENIDGYISGVNNTYSAYDIDEFRYLSDSEIKYSARGNVRFTAHVKNEYVQDVIDMFDEFCKSNDFAVLDYNQYIENYEHVKVVDNVEEQYYGNVYTKEEIEDMLEYTDLSFNLHYYIERDNTESFVLKSLSVFNDIFDIGKELLIPIFWIIIFAWLILFCMIVPIRKYYKKSMYKFITKHPEYNIPTNIVICDNIDIVSSDKNSQMTVERNNKDKLNN